MCERLHCDTQVLGPQSRTSCPGIGNGTAMAELAGLCTEQGTEVPATSNPIATQQSCVDACSNPIATRPISCVDACSNVPMYMLHMKLVGQQVVHTGPCRRACRRLHWPRMRTARRVCTLPHGNIPAPAAIWVCCMTIRCTDPCIAMLWLE